MVGSPEAQGPAADGPERKRRRADLVLERVRAECKDPALQVAGLRAAPCRVEAAHREADLPEAERQAADRPVEALREAALLAREVLR